MQHLVSGMVESAVDKTLRSLQNCKQHNGVWLNKYTALAAEIGINSDLAEKDATTFDRDVRVKLLDTLTANINKRYNYTSKWKVTFHSDYTFIFTAVVLRHCFIYVCSEIVSFQYSITK